MSDRTFKLKPFKLSELDSQLNITGNIFRDGSKLNLDYQLQGNLSRIIIPPPVEIPSRKDELWQTTCCEFFLGIQHSPQYWEFNLSPSGDWNIYRFTNYRQGMEEETAFTSLPFEVEHRLDSLKINLEINLDLIIEKNTALEIAITTVIESRKGIISYWALTHPETIANFHNRNSFIIYN